MAAPKQMIRLSNGEVMPYSASLVAARPGAFVAARWNAAVGKFERVGDAPLVPPPEPPSTPGVVPGDDWDDESLGAKHEDWHDPEPETAGADEAAEPKAVPRKRARRALPKD